MNMTSMNMTSNGGVSGGKSGRNGNGIEERALELLGSGIGPEIVASALGVTPARISQLLSDTEFSELVSQKRFENLSKHNVRDSRYDELEDTLITKLDETLPMMHRPMEILKAISVINAAKRRGASAPEAITHQNQVVNITMPVQILQQFTEFTTNINNQVTKAGERDLLTIQSGVLLNSTNKKLQLERTKDGD